MYTKANKQRIRKAYISKGKPLSAILPQYIQVNGGDWLMQMPCTHNYWVLGLGPSSGVLKTREHNVSETASGSVLRLGVRDTYPAASLRIPNFNHWPTHI
jgi:hypothetical protein